VSYIVSMKTVTVRAKEGETKYAVILRVLKCNTFAAAVNKYGLGNSNNAWEELENIAVTEIRTSRHYAALRRMFPI